MHIITQKRIREAEERFPESSRALKGWCRIMEKNIFHNFDALKKTFNSVDKVGKFHIFDISGNKLRLITSIHYNRQKIYIRAILSHTEYDKEKWKK